MSCFCKPLIWGLFLSVASLSACSTNPATGKSQFTALMSPEQELRVGASEHEKIIQQFGLYEGKALESYVRSIGQRVSQYTERPDIQYKFFIVDSPIVNAFALPGGYIYVSRGLLALAGSEAELAAVLAHETGHITGRHSAERYSTGVLTSLGTSILSAAIDSTGASQALGLGSNLYLSSYSRGQENEADTLGLRYLSRGGYSTDAMTSFLSSLQAQSALDRKLNGKTTMPVFSYFSTHPATADRVSKTKGEAQQYGPGGTVNKDGYLSRIDGLVYGDSVRQGFIRDQSFYHPEMDFTFSVPQGFKLINQPHQVVASSKATGAVVIFDMVGNKGADPMTFLTQIWMKEPPPEGVEQIIVNGMPSATAAFPGKVNGKPMTIRLMAIRWAPDRYARFQIAIPKGASEQLIEDLKRSSYSLRSMTDKEKQTIKPYAVRIITAKAGDTVKSLARRQPFDTLQEEHFRVLNGLNPGEELKAGQIYKLITP